MGEVTNIPPVRVLVLDDETALVNALLSTLRENGYEAAGATTPTQALERLKARRFDVVLTDLHLPEMDGIAFIGAAHAIDPELIAVMMTGHGSIDTAVDAMKAGAVDYVLKPFKLRTLQTVVARALTERKLRRENEALQRSLAARTHELEAANGELEAFAYSVSHDLRAPLRTIAGFTEALIEECMAGNYANIRSYGDRVKRNVNRMGTMIDDLLRMSKAVRTELEIARFDLTACCEEIAAKLSASAPERKVTWSILPGMQVDADPGLLRIAMENLLGNAWKYTARCDVAELGVSLRRNGNESTVEVRDNGVGFDMAEIRNLFIPFQRLTTARDFAGTGIGLSTVRRVIERHGGRVWATAELGRGATFLFTLPDAVNRSNPTLPGHSP
jgi:signal transduction histidine kinase